MPFRSLYREQMTPAEFETPGALCIVHPEYEEQDHRTERWHELNFTAYPQHQLQQTQLSSSGVPKYPTAMEMDDSQSFLRQGRQNYLADAASGPTPTQFSEVPFSYSQLLDIASTPTTDSSAVQSVRTNSMADSSTSERSFSPIGATAQEKMCPLITGETDSCQPDRCGPEAPCMNFTNIPPIEECASVPCMTRPETDKAPKPERQMSSRSTESSRPTRFQPSRQNSSDVPAKHVAKAEAKRRAKQAHSLVEKKYRENLNAKLVQLHDTLKVARYRPKKNRDIDDDDSDEFGSANACNAGKFRKGEVLDDALDYVNQTEVEMRHMENEIQRLMDMIGLMQRRIYSKKAGQASR